MRNVRPRISKFAPAAALISIAIALLISLPAASGVPVVGPSISGLTTICLSLPWLFLFIILRAELPLHGPHLVPFGTVRRNR